MQTTSADSAIYHRPRPSAGRRGSPAKQPPIGTIATVADGFLNHCFLPLYASSGDLPEEEAVEKEIMGSLTNLQEHYGISLTDYGGMPYPYNVLLSRWEANRKIRIKNRYRELLITRQDGKPACFAVRESFSRPFNLYYIPVLPLYALWQDKAHRPIARLLTAICAYLYINAGISYYRDEDNHLYDNYEMLREWITEDPEAADIEEYQRQLQAIENAESGGDSIRRKMLKGHSPERLRRLLSTFPSDSEYSQRCLSVANETLRLWEEYPDANIYRNANHCQCDDDEDDYWGRSYIAMHEYIGFIGSADDIISDSLLGMVNNDFNERSDFQEPEITAFFDEPQSPYSGELDYEYRLFKLMEDLCTLLNKKP